MIYLNNAASSFPKPSEVLEAQAAALAAAPESQHRSNAADGGTDATALCRERLSFLLGTSRPERIFFCSGATHALNLLLGGLPQQYRCAVVTATEHNSVLRPLYNSPVFAGRIAIVPCDNAGRVHPAAFEEALRAAAERWGPGVAVVNHCSNVTGAIQDAAALARAARSHGFLFLLDAAQSAGSVPLRLDGWGVDMLAFTGHKALLGPAGTGGFFVRDGLRLRPLIYGGTGTDSDKLTYGPDEQAPLEAGTQNTPGIAGLLAGVEYALAHPDAGKSLRDELKKELDSIPGVRTYGPETGAGAVLGFNIDGLSPSDAGYILRNEFDIVVRTGLHCSPLIHDAIGAGPRGTVRASFSCLNTPADVRALVQAVRQMSKSAAL